MFIRLLLLCLPLAFAPVRALACLCNRNPETFCESVDTFYTVLQVRLLALHNDAGHHYLPLADVEISRQLAGAFAPDRDTISLLQQDGLNCNDSWEGFDIGQEFILAIVQDPSEWVSDSIQQLLPYPLYDLRDCGHFYLFIDGEEVSGPIRPGVAEESLSDFLQRLEACSGLVPTPTGEPGDGEVRLYPNPAYGQVRLELPEGMTPLRLELYAATGQRLGEWAVAAPPFELPVDRLPAGLYYLRIHTQHGDWVRRLVVGR